MRKWDSEREWDGESGSETVGWWDNETRTVRVCDGETKRVWEGETEKVGQGQ